MELFAGVGGFRLGLERAGHEVIWANEWSPQAADVYDHNFGGKIDRRNLRDIRAGEVPAHDLICAGFPCQPFSIAGKRAGFADLRGALFFEILRLARHHRTPYLLLENVRGLLSHDGGWTFWAILHRLDAAGYNCQWQVLDSSYFGVPQSRARIFIVAHRRDLPRPAVFPLHGEGGTTAYADPGVERPAYVVSDIDMFRFKSRNPRFRHLGPAYTLTLKQDQGIAFTVDGHDWRVRRLTEMEYERLQGFPDGWTDIAARTQRYRQMGNAVSVPVIEAIGRRLPR